jgi:hypothetical protein
MNVEQLKKNVGSHVKIRPRAVSKMPGNDRTLPQRDDDWMITRVENNRVSLQNSTTDHVVDLGNDEVKEYRSSGHLLLRCKITLSGDRVHREPITGA